MRKQKLNVTTKLTRYFTKFISFFNTTTYNIPIKQDSYTKANETGEEAQKETVKLVDIGLPQSENNAG